MSKATHAEMNLDELSVAMQTAAIREYEVFVTGEPVARQREWVKKLNALQEEIQARGDGALKRYVPLLKAEQPSVRLAAALGLRKTAPNLALPVLEELRDGKYGGTIATNVRMTIGVRKA